jgi:uridine kinase
LKIVKSIDNIFNTLFEKHKESKKGIFIILVGGCSRAGKSSLSLYLEEKFKCNEINCRILNLDSWLISVDKRKTNSKVLERFEIIEINKAVKNILNNEIVIPPFYNPVSRKREKNSSGQPIKLESGILIVEGVISLAVEYLLNISDVNIYVDITDTLRIKRLIHFYKDVKKIEKDRYKKIIQDREIEETLFIKNTKNNADFIFCWDS